MAVFAIFILIFYAESKYGALTSVYLQIESLWPGAHIYLAPLTGALWFSALMYAVKRRRELNVEVDARKAAEAILQLRQISDEVSGLPNRFGLEAYLNERLASEDQSHDLVLLAVEVRNLALVAHVHGPEIANMAVRTLTEQLLSLIGPEDFIARGDGCVFYIVVDDRADQVSPRMEKVLHHLTHQLQHITLSNGIALPAMLAIGRARPVHSAVKSSDVLGTILLRKVDLAVNEATNARHTHVFDYTADLDTNIGNRAVIEASITNALRDNDIVPYFHPLLSLSTGQVVGFEVLARWSHNKLGHLSPGKFIEIAEQTGRINEITLHILEQACRIASEWPSQFRLAVNLSPTSLTSPAFIDSFIAKMKETRFPAERLEVEITENAFIERASTVGPAIRRLKDLGISISIDDFGTGYSSLHHLRILPFDKIKIDQSFVRDINLNQDSLSIVETILALGRGMGLKIVAEGIETIDVLNRLKELGCDIGQGYFFAPPLNGHDAQIYLLRNIGAIQPLQAVPPPKQMRATGSNLIA